MVRTFLRAFGACVTLLALLVGLPGVLGYGTWAIALHARPEQGSLTQLLTRPDNGNLFLWALVAVGWIAWPAFAVSVLVEIPAQLRGRVARRLPALGWSQRLAGGLVGAVLALLPMAGGALAATGAPAPRLAVSAPLTPDFATGATGVETAPEVTAPVHAAAHGHHPHYVVRATRPAETLWSIAQHTLGSGERWREIAALNEGRVMDAQHRVFDAERPIQPGWQLLLPRDAQLPHTAHAVPATSAAGSAATPRHDRQVTVRPGDTLSAIAQREMGSAEAWPRLFAANRGATAPDGTRLTDPNLIEPGMRLTIPATSSDAHGGPQPPVSTSAGSGSGASGGGATGSPGPTPTPPATSTPTPTGGAFTHGGAGGSASATPHSTPAPAAQTPVPGSLGAAAHGGHQSAGQFAVAAGTSVLGAVLVGTVALRRSRRRTVPPRQTPQHRASGRPPKPPVPGVPRLEPAAVPLPPVPAPPVPAPPAPGPYVPTLQGRPAGPPAGPPADSPAGSPAGRQAVPPVVPTPLPPLGPLGPAEQQSARDLDLLGRALRSMARNVAREGRRLPPINVVRVTAAHTVELHLVAPAPPVAPFRAAHASTVWWCTPDAPGLLGPEAAAVVPSPYPALVSLGETVDGATVLVDLEAIRLLHVSGEPHDIARVMRTLALELTFTPLADRVGVHVVGVAQELAAVADDRLVVHPDLEHAVAALQRRDAAVRSALVQAGAATPREARSRGLGGDEWAPEVVLCASYPTGDVPEALGRLLDARPRGSVAVITAAPPQGTGPVARWTLPAAGHGVVPGLEMDIQLQRLDDDTYHHWLRLLGADLVPPTVTETAPPPSWPPTGPVGDDPADLSSRFPVPTSYGRTALPDVPSPREASFGRFPAPGVPVLRSAPFADPTAPRQEAPLSGRFPAPDALGTTPQGLGAAGPARDPRTGPTPPSGDPQPAAPIPGASAPMTSPGTVVSGRFPAPGAPWRTGTGTPPAGTAYPAPPAYPAHPVPAAPGMGPTAPPPAPRAPGALPSGAVHPGPAAPDPGFVTLPPAPGAPGQLPSGVAHTAPSARGAGSAGLHCAPASPHAPDGASRLPGPGYPAVAAASAYGAPPQGAAAAGPVPGTSPMRVAPEGTWDSVAVVPGTGLVPVGGAGDGTGDGGAPDAWILTLLAAPPARTVPGEAKLRVLGPVELSGAAGPVEAEWRPGLVEVAARRALGPAQGAYASADAIGRLRAWLGDGPDGRPVNLGCDWDDFRTLRARGVGEDGQAADTALARALALVRGAPFAEVAYPWADTLRARMTAAVVDVAHELTLRRLRVGDHRGAEAAAHRGLVAEPDAELLLRDLVLLHADAGQGPQLQRTVARLETKAARTGVALEPESAALIDELRSAAVDPLSRR